MKKKLFLAMFFLTLVFIGYKYIYHEHREISSEKEVFNDTALVLKQDFHKNLDESSGKYLNKTIVVSGVISEVEVNAIMIDDNVYCVFGKNINELIIGKQVKVKGRCLGYDELLEVVKIDQSIVLKK